MRITYHIGGSNLKGTADRGRLAHTGGLGRSMPGAFLFCVSGEMVRRGLAKVHCQVGGNDTRPNARSDKAVTLLGTHSVGPWSWRRLYFRAGSSPASHTFFLSES